MMKIHRNNRVPGKVFLDWDTASHPRALVRDAATGETLGSSDQGGVELQTASQELEVLLSDGVRTVRRLLTVN